MSTAQRIPGADWALWQATTTHYDYATDHTHCPICGGAGWVWRNWFSCDGTCGAIAVVTTGQVFLPIPLPRRKEETP
jgi:hypothetical protein